MHFARHAFADIISVKNARRRPVTIAPNRLVAANVTARSNREVNTVPIKPTRRKGRMEHTHLRIPVFLMIAVMIGANTRYPVAMPNNTHKNAGVKVITAI